MLLIIISCYQTCVFHGNPCAIMQNTQKSENEKTPFVFSNENFWPRVNQYLNNDFNTYPRLFFVGTPGAEQQEQEQEQHNTKTCLDTPWSRVASRHVTHAQTKRNDIPLGVRRRINPPTSDIIENEGGGLCHYLVANLILLVHFEMLDLVIDVWNGCIRETCFVFETFDSLKTHLFVLEHL